MFKFRGFRASLDFISRKQRAETTASTPVSIGGAYKVNRDDCREYDYAHRQSQALAPAAQIPIKPPRFQNTKSKSTSDLVQSTATVQKASQSTTHLSQDSRASKRLAKEQKKLQKQQLAEQRKQEKIAAKERLKQEKLTKERERRERIEIERRQSNERIKCRKKRNAPQPPQNPTPSNNNQASNNNSININPRLDNNIQSQNIQRQPYSTNTLESSISRSTGPPPYGEYPEIVIDDNNTGNISFGKPVDFNSSWDLISQHREQIAKPTTSAPVAPRRKKDLQYNVGNLQIGSGEGNSEA